uniref:Uncharacterized protein n=1 Tax=viral metagenome TaxID=1070528 RepID=A0A6C0IS78_9ZZZZ
MNIEQLKLKYRQDVKALREQVDEKLDKLHSQRNINITYKNNLIDKYKKEYISNMVALYKTLKNNINNITTY